MTRLQRAEVAWLCVRMQLSYTAITRDLFDGDLVCSLLLPAIVEANVGHLDADADISRRHQALDAAYPDELRRPANALSIAHFLDIPRETARARLTGMVASGVLQRRPGGYVLPTATLIAERFLPAVPRYLETLNEFISGLGRVRAFGLVPGSALACPVWPVAWSAMRLSTAHVLRETAFTRELAAGMSLTSSHILLFVCQAVGAQLRLPPLTPACGRGLAAFEPTCGPVRSTAVAAGLGLPPETVRRHLKKLAAAGFLKRGPRGYDIVLDDKTLPALDRFQKRAQANTRQLIWRLTTTGVVPPVG